VTATSAEKKSGNVPNVRHAEKQNPSKKSGNVRHAEKQIPATSVTLT
jgi:hypothetical protein